MYEASIEEAYSIPTESIPRPFSFTFFGLSLSFYGRCNSSIFSLSLFSDEFFIKK